MIRFDANYRVGGVEFRLPVTVGVRGPQGVQGERGDSGETGPQGPKGETGATGQQGPAGADGATFTPNVTAEGILSWTNDGGKANPTAVNIRGPKGDTGATGPQGPKGETGVTGAQGPKGETGATFTPSVTAEGVLSWTNDGGLANPASVNIRGPKGETGDTGATGAQGPKGDPGKDFHILGYYATLDALESAAPSPSAGDAYGVGSAAPYRVYVYDGVNGLWVDNGTIQGPQGETGPQGPKGETGDTGATGPAGADGVTFTPGVTAEGVLSWTNDGGLANPASVNIRGPKGDTGDTGATGAQGPKGDTPQKGVDYWTTADQEQMVQDVLAALPNASGVSF